MGDVPLSNNHENLGGKAWVFTILKFSLIQQKEFLLGICCYGSKPTTYCKLRSKHWLREKILEHRLWRQAMKNRCTGEVEVVQPKAKKKLREPSANIMYRTMWYRSFNALEKYLVNLDNLPLLAVNKWHESLVEIQFYMLYRLWSHALDFRCAKGWNKPTVKSRKKERRSA